MQLSAKVETYLMESLFLMAAYDRDYIGMNLLDFNERRFSISFHFFFLFYVLTR